MKKSLLFLSIIILMGLGACTTQNNEDDITQPEGTKVVLNINAASKKLVKSSSNFGIDLTNKIAEKEIKKANWMISPLSITLALAMTYNGADGDTKKAMEETLRLKGLNINEINNNFKDLVNKLLSVDKKVDIAIANAIWCKRGFDIIPNFMNVNKKFYNAEVSELDFLKPEAVDIINTWVANNTNDKITSIFDKLPKSTIMVLANAIYFKGIWKYNFKPEKNIQLPFFYKDGSTKEIEMMRCKADFRIFSNNKIALVEMPYGQGNWVMDLVMTNDNEPIEELMKTLTTDKWNNWISKLSEPTTVGVILPPFKFDYTKQLKECLTELGMGIAFDPENADFKKINKKKDICISKVKHKTFIELNEKGTEAAAVTAVVMVETTSVGGGSSNPVFTFDKPFMFAIREVSTNTIAFIGKVGDPKR